MEKRVCPPHIENETGKLDCPSGKRLPSCRKIASHRPLGRKPPLDRPLVIRHRACQPPEDLPPNLRRTGVFSNGQKAPLRPQYRTIPARASHSEKNDKPVHPQMLARCEPTGVYENTLTIGLDSMAGIPPARSLPVVPPCQYGGRLATTLWTGESEQRPVKAV